VGLCQLRGRRRDSAPRRRPITDILAALYAAFSVTLRTPCTPTNEERQRVDVSLFESGVSAVSQWITIYNLTGATVRRFGNSYPLLAPYELFETKDRPIVSPWVTMSYGEAVRIIARRTSSPTLDFGPILTESFRPTGRPSQESFRGLEKRTSDSWVSALKDVGIPTGVINSVEDLPQTLNSREGSLRASQPLRAGKVRIVAAIPRCPRHLGGSGFPLHGWESTRTRCF